MTERYPQQSHEDIISNMDTIAFNGPRKFSAPGFDDKGTEIIDLRDLDTEKIDSRELRRRFHLGDIATKGIYDRQDELNRVLGPDTNAPETESFDVGLINVAALRARLHNGGDAQQTPAPLDDVRPGYVSANSRANRNEIMSHAPNPSWIRR